ncbi:hypothetical protein LTR87_001176 [Friedmanniomyces endolithicus]|nr:hypothetical protein LTR87_001176 [Friedmanniomyces endolithicus]
MAQTAPAQHSPPEAPRRPKGILKNSSSYQHISPEARVSPTSERTPVAQHENLPATIPSTSTTENSRPSIPNRELSEKDITQLNTERNAGEHRRTSSNPRVSLSRRQSTKAGTPRKHWTTSKGSD